MFFVRSLRQNFRSLEWIFLTAHLGMFLSASGYNLPLVLGFCSALFLMSWVFPINRPRWQRLSYIVLGLLIILWARSLNVDLFLQLIYFGKSYFLLGHRSAIALVIITAIPSVFSEYLGNVSLVQQSTGVDPLGLNPSNPVRFIFFALAIYTAASFFTIMLSEMIVAQQKSYQKIEELSEQVESLATALERTRIAREIHDSLGHTLTDLDTQLAVAQTLRSHNPDYPWIRVLVLTTFDDDEYILRSLQAGALGYLLKRTPAPEIAAAIRSVAQGYSQLGPTIASKAFSQFKPLPSNSYPDLLSKREIDVLKLVGEGKNNQEIAQTLFLSEGTVKNYVTQILSKLEMRDRVQAALWAQRHLL